MPHAAHKAAREPASIRYKNPGAMWPGKSAKKYGSTQSIRLNDGQGNEIAVFPDVVHGAAAQFDLWRSNYCDMSLLAAIRKWSGHNSSAAYMDFLRRRVSVSPQTKVTPALLASIKGIELMKAQAHWEAGKPYPMTDEQWAEAQRMVFAVA